MLRRSLGFLASWHLTGSRDFHLRVQCASGSERSFIESNLCRFDKEIFLELGNDVRKLTVDPCRYSRFIGQRSTTGLEYDPSSF